MGMKLLSFKKNWITITNIETKVRIFTFNSDTWHWYNHITLLLSHSTI